MHQSPLYFLLSVTLVLLNGVENLLGILFRHLRLLRLLLLRVILLLIILLVLFVLIVLVLILVLILLFLIFRDKIMSGVSRGGLKG